MSIGRRNLHHEAPFSLCLSSAIVFTLKLMTYNIQGQAAARRSDHIEKIAEVIAGISPDIAGLQEVHCRTRQAGIDQGETLAGLTGLNLAFGRSCSMGGGDYGNAVLTRGTVMRSEISPLPGGGEPRSLMRADVDVDGTPLSFFVTHLSAWGRLRRRDRLAQIARVGAITAEAPHPHVLTGDFNVPPKAEEIRVLTAEGHLRASDPLLDFTYRLLRQRLDYVFCDPRWTVLKSDVIRKGPSDHWPVVVELGLKES
jgi:endonuclease/exonuclease/phosphatase family metal-dependent hydrolase